MTTNRPNPRAKRASAEYELAEIQSRLAAVVDNIVDGIITIDQHGVILSFSRVAARQFGYDPGEVIGKNVSVLMPEPHRQFHDRYIQRYLSTGERRIIGIGREVEGMRKDGSVFPIDLAVNEFEFNGERYFSGIVRDITERKRAEQQFREMEERSRQLQLQHTELERIAVAGELASIVTHEIRTPLNALSINVQMIQRALKRRQPDDLDKAEQLVTTVRNEIERINTLLEDYLRSLRRPREQNPHLFALNRVIVDAIRFVELTAAKRNVVIKSFLSGAEPSIFGSEDAMRQVLLNLVLNAMQAMPEGGIIRISTEIAEREIKLSVADNGPGIATDALDRIFHPFVTTKSKGTGLGLAICKRLIGEMNGTITVASEPNRGACFIVSLPKPP